MYDTLQAARELARHWREAKGDEAVGGVVLVLDNHFVGWTAELPPADQWVDGCLAIAGDGHAYLANRRSWREPLQWFDLEPLREAETDPPPPPINPTNPEAP